MVDSKFEKVFYDESGNPRMVHCYCAFIDVLGFNKKIEDSFKANNQNELFLKFYSVANPFLRKMDKDLEGDFLCAKVFTDNVVLAYPFISDDGESEFGFTIWTLLEYQLHMALEGFFVRGGLAIGDLFMDEYMVYGTGILNAYALENKTARDPRIVLSDDVTKKVHSHLEFYANQKASPQNMHVLIDADGKAFLNYLSELIYEDEDGNSLNWEGLSRHKDQIIKAIEENYQNHEVWSKYFWLVNYHNYFCSSQAAAYHGYNESFLVPEKYARRHPESLVK